jgi:hypothetical protein
MVASPDISGGGSETELQSTLKANPDLFVKVLSRIVRVIKYNFLTDLQHRENSQPALRSGEPEIDSMAYLRQIKQTMASREMLCALTALHAQKQPPLGFNSLFKVAGEPFGAIFSDKREIGKQANIFLSFANKKGASLPRRESHLIPKQQNEEVLLENG